MKIKIIIKDRTATIEIQFITKTLLKIISCLSIKTILSAKRLFKKCANIGTKILSVFKYKIAIQTAKIKAEKIDPKL